MATTTELPLHPLALMFPELPEAELRALVASIAEHGQLSPATSWIDGAGTEWLIDGRHRALACARLGLDLQIERIIGTEAEARALVLGKNVLRRHLSPSARAAAASALSTRGRGESGKRASLTQAEAARVAGVSVRLVRAARTFASDAHLTSAVLRGEVTVSEAARRARNSLRLSLGRESETQEWLTPWPLVERVVQALERIDGDPCAEPGRRIPASWHLTEEDDGLSRSWANPDGAASRLFINPPWDGAARFVRRLLAEFDAGRVEQAIVLLPARLGSDYIHALTSRGYPRVELRGRLQFEPGRGAVAVGRGEAHFSSMLIGVGVTTARMYAAFADTGVVMQAWTPSYADEVNTDARSRPLSAVTPSSGASA